MRLSISNIAWDISEDIAVACLLKKYDIDAIDIAPGKYFQNIINTRDNEIMVVRNWWNNQGIDIVGMQALLFGTTDLNLFASSSIQDKMLNHLTAVCRISAGLGAKNLVFGSPKNRDRSGLTNDEAINKSLSFFKKLGDIAQSYNVYICLEPNPQCYGANFMINTPQTAEIVKLVDHSNIKMQLDTGAMTINHESFGSFISQNSKYYNHIHLSEPNLLPLGDLGTTSTNHAKVAKELFNSLPRLTATIEMLATIHEPHLESIERSLKVATKFYKRVPLENKL